MDITKFRSHLWVALEQLSLHLQEARSTLTQLGGTVVDKPRRFQDTFRAREGEVRELLASSVDAMAVTKSDRRFVVANPAALDLFKVSDVNMSNFTMDAFLSDPRIPAVHRNVSPFVRREERHGKCEIRRLDGSSRVVECLFVPNFVPGRHLYRFLNVMPPGVNQLSLKMSTCYTNRVPPDEARYSTVLPSEICQTLRRHRAQDRPRARGRR
jgi:PAS domain-containing protein